MAVPGSSFMYNQAGYEILDRSVATTIDLETVSKLKIMLVGSGYNGPADDSAHKSVEVVDAAGAGDIIDGEITATGYTGGYGGSGRLALSTPTFGSGPDDTNDRVEFDAADVDWGTLGNGANDTIIGAVVIIEDHLGVTGDDTETRAAWYYDLADFTTNGTSFGITWSAEGLVQWVH